MASPDRTAACVHHYVMVRGGMACQKCGHVMGQPERADDAAASIDPRFVCRREGHVPAVRFANMKASGVDVPSSYFTSCIRCGEAIEVELPKEAGTYGDA